jgi:2-keto-3-deoxy-L-rhamnonate aldolase RhmA
LGIVVPMVNSRQQAEQAAQAAKYPPLGSHSKGGDLAYHSGDGYFEKANEETLLLVKIEHIEAVKSVEPIRGTNLFRERCGRLLYGAGRLSIIDGAVC